MLLNNFKYSIPYFSKFNFSEKPTSTNKTLFDYYNFTLPKKYNKVGMYGYEFILQRSKKKISIIFYQKSLMIYQRSQ